jgi:hypothetical protein
MDYSRLPAYPGESEPPPWPREEESRDLCETTILMILLFLGAGVGSLFALWLTACCFEVYLRNLREFIAKPLGAISVVEKGFTKSVDMDGTWAARRGEGKQPQTSDSVSLEPVVRSTKRFMQPMANPSAAPAIISWVSIRTLPFCRCIPVCQKRHRRSTLLPQPVQGPVNMDTQTGISARQSFFRFCRYSQP